jgi:hypothetical protein
MKPKAIIFFSYSLLPPEIGKHVLLTRISFSMLPVFGAEQV